MSAITDNKVTISGFSGLFDRGIADACPPDHFTVCNNAVFPGPSQVRTREGTELTHTTTEPIVHFFQAVLPTRTFLLNLSATGKLYDGVTVLTTWTGANGFAAINLYNRVYLCPTYNGQPLTGEYLYYYDGTNPIQKAAGAAPFTAPAAAHVNPGMVEIGVHKVAVAYVTRTGFITKYGPSVSDNSPGGRDIELTAIPIGPSDVVGRWILATKANEAEFFFVPNGYIANNTTTALDIDFLDSDLVISASYLADELTEIPAGAALRFYKGRLAIVGSLAGNRTCVYFSRAAEPESFNDVDSMATFPVNPLITPVLTGWELRDVFYVVAFVGVWSTQDNGDVPSTWPISVVDAGLGCYDNGVSAAFNIRPAADQMDMLFIAAKTGLFVFDGMFRLPALSWKIDDVWQDTTYASFWKVCVAHDTWRKRVFINAPSTAYPACILMMDYSEGLSAEKVKWSRWGIPVAIPTHIGMANPEPDAAYILRISTLDQQGIVGVIPGAVTDFGGAAIYFLVTTALVQMKPGYVSVYTALRFRMLGGGTADISIYGEDGVGTTVVLGLPLTALPGLELLRMINFTNEKLQVALSTDPTPVGGWIHLQRMEIFGVPRWMMRPTVPA